MTMTEETLFEQARNLPAGERAAFLDRECPDPALRAGVEALLAADEASRSPLDRPVSVERTGAYTPKPEHEPATTAEHRPDSEVGSVIAGRYKLRQQIGEGGMGSVWM